MITRFTSLAILKYFFNVFFKWSNMQYVASKCSSPPLKCFPLFLLHLVRTMKQCLMTNRLQILLGLHPMVLHNWSLHNDEVMRIGLGFLLLVIGLKCVNLNVDYLWAWLFLQNKSIVRIRNPLIFKLISCMREIIYRK